MKYGWKAKSDDGAFEDASIRWFDTHKEAYNNMRHHALAKMKWNTEWNDFDDLCEEDFIAYGVQFSRNKIVHNSYSGEYTYEIVEHPEIIRKHDRTWEVLESFTPKEMYDWPIATFDEVGEMWMNNHDGYMVLIEPSGRILKSDI